MRQGVEIEIWEDKEAEDKIRVANIGEIVRIVEVEEVIIEVVVDLEAAVETQGREGIGIR